MREKIAVGQTVFTGNWVRLLKNNRGTFAIQDLRTGSQELATSEEGHSVVDIMPVGVAQPPASPHFATTNQYAVTKVCDQVIQLGLVAEEYEASAARR